MILVFHAQTHEIAAKYILDIFVELRRSAAFGIHVYHIHFHNRIAMLVKRQRIIGQKI